MSGAQVDDMPAAPSPPPSPVPRRPPPAAADTAPPAGERPVGASARPVVGDVVALGLVPDPRGTPRCPTGRVVAVDDLGLRVRLVDWTAGVFAGPDQFVPWSRVLLVQWAEHPGEPDAAAVECTALRHFQVGWTWGPSRYGVAPRPVRVRAGD